ncbi:hypothetical protein BH10ACI3_BH10ACI3_29720 [soil metagenome]
MTSRNRYIAVFFGLVVGVVVLVFGITVIRTRLSADTNPCPEGSVPSFHPGECRELLPMEIDTTFPWDRQQAESKEFFRQFQKNILADKRNEVASMMMYPLRVNYYADPKAADYRFLNSPAELFGVYDEVFHKSVKDYIVSYDADKVWGNDYFLQTGTGAIGIYCKTIGECPSCSFEFKVKIIHSNSIYRDTIEDVFGNPLKPGDKP